MKQRLDESSARPLQGLLSVPKRVMPKKMIHVPISVPISIIVMLSAAVLFSCSPATMRSTTTQVVIDPQQAGVELIPHEYFLDNGLKVLMVEDHKAPIATFQIWYKVGSLNESTGKTGLSHMLEHMMFKGTKRYGSKVFSNLIQKNGGVDNAFTTRDYTMYYQTLISDRLELSIELEADRMQNLLLSEEDVKSEKQVVMEERRLRTEDNPQNLLFEQLTEKALSRHPYRNPVIGWMDDIASFTVEDLRGHYNNYYSPDNAVIIVTGDIKPAEILKQLKTHFGPIPAKHQAKANIPTEPMQEQSRRLVLRRPAQLPYLLMAYHVPSIPHKDSYALDVLSAIFSGKSGRLYQELVKNQKVALNSFVFYSGFHTDPYLMYFGGSVMGGKGDSTDALEHAILAEIEKVKTTPPTEREIQKAKNQIEASFIMGQDSIYFQGELLGMYEMLGNWRLKDKYLEEIRGVTVEDVKRVAATYLITNNSTVGTLIPE
ncbi:zinc protease [Candidatus Magnetobacterium bavaricum]|uniref:Zinc protease n=1 Tax=Candidatus Magnetobacterium bavaricum TaxID=29290 RepID=A0A0F3GXJ1_9BACT|nr:zinc protease [Candidatus Magnetobacterium bavaricum]